MLYLSWAVFCSVSGSQPGYGASILVTCGFLNVASSKHALWKEVPEKILKIVNDFSYKQTNLCICVSLLCVRKKNFKPLRSVSAHTESKKINFVDLLIAIHVPMIYTALCIMFWMLTSYKFFGPQMALAYRLDAISQGPKNSRYPGPNPLPLAQAMDIHTNQSIMHRKVYIIGA